MIFLPSRWRVFGARAPPPKFSIGKSRPASKSASGRVTAMKAAAPTKLLEEVCAVDFGTRGGTRTHTPY